MPRLLAHECAVRTLHTFRLALFCCLQVLLPAQEDVEAMAARTKVALKSDNMQPLPAYSLLK